MKSARLQSARLFTRSLSVCALLALLACSPKFNWREVHSKDAPYSVLLPAKPSTFSRPIDLDGVPVTMTMTAAKVDDTVFAVGSATVPDAARAQAALIAMKTALVKNINGTVKAEKTNAAANNAQGLSASIDVEAVGATPGGKPEVLFGHFVSKDKEIYQVIVMGPETAVSRENAETFIASFKHN
ncbi:hypothetical protein SAMN04515617_10983 [Collimonas sp. OK242]|uniref:hypothetical protein n=1 Tax=Collimonas sp. OK242 TaxID=1798195 RepID=UPI000897E17B|nr:hypothetical protein [Collimonas sp. OK242]SDY02672.1 hypothetical protein SAMN04515617_10983 [Collimonas sp. OK242]